MHSLTRTGSLVPGLSSGRLSFRFLNQSTSGVYPLKCIRNLPRLLLNGARTESSVSCAASAGVGVPTVKERKNVERVAGNGKGPAPTFQEAIFKLQEYWSSVGCAVWLPHNTEVGAGTMNPATYLRVLGPEPWNVCYAEPSIRPDDSRYGDNPNRVQRHTQFQVILKPDPGNPQELYLGSLAALGINTRAHDVRFVEDNWESPVLGAWGLGWEVWLDGMEVTQFTYFQQAGGKPLPVPAVEITYGLERILMALQGMDHFKDIMYNSSITYGELFLQNEYEMSCYNMDKAVVEDHWKRFELFQSEANAMLELGLPIPAYDNLLKCSHSFNILDARGAVGVTERNNCFAVMRNLARSVAKCWVERRQELEHPLGIVEPKSVAVDQSGIAKGACEGSRKLLVEIGCEELPPADVTSVVAQLETKVKAMLDASRLDYGKITVEGTPRRIAILVDNLAGRQEAKEEKVRGPPAKIAFGPDGAPTKALQGFCKKSGASVDDVTREADAKGVEYVFAVVREEPRTSVEILCEALPGVLSTVSFKRSMRWACDVAWSRPLRWLVGMHGDTVVPFSYAGLIAGQETRLLRNADLVNCAIPSAEEYFSVMQSNRIDVEIEKRKQKIWDAVQGAAADQGGLVPVSFEEDLLMEVNNLVESPTVLVGTFDERFLELPKDVLVTVMRKHQRYFPIVSQADSEQILPMFVTVANGQVDLPTVQSGNEAVLRARFQDAQFFYEEDLKKSLDELRPKLQGTMFQKALGTLLDKTERTEKLVGPLAELSGLEDSTNVAQRAARISQADLASAMVMEMTSLAGTMGRHYALKDGESPDVAQAIFESVLPRFSGDMVPSTKPGVLVCVADKMNSLVGLVAAGCAPSATADPYALRRSAYGMLQTLIANKVRLDLARGVDLAAGLQPIEVSEDSRKEAVEFIQRRLEQLLIDQGLQIPAVRSILSERGTDPYLASVSAEELSKQLDTPNSLLESVMTPLSRPIRIVRGKDVDAEWTVDPSLFEFDEEKNLWDAFQQVRQEVNESSTVLEFLTACQSLVDPIDRFFDKVFVMCEDQKVQQNRLTLLREVATLPKGVLDFAELPGF